MIQSEQIINSFNFARNSDVLVINGSEKVVVAQERMSNNHVYCFRKKQPHK